jgi:hypothetical protein
MKKNQFYIVRSDRAGVFFGQIKQKKVNSVVMINVRKIYYWDGAAAVEQIAIDGVNDLSKLTVIVPEMEIERWIQIIPCSKNAVENLQAKKEWKR